MLGLLRATFVIFVFSWLALVLHSENPELRVGDRRVVRHRQSERQRAPRLRRVENPIVPQPRRGVVRRALVVVLVEDRLTDGGLFLGRDLLTVTRELIA